MTKQEIFSKIVTKLLEQKTRSTILIDGEERCAYRSPGGLKCAVGHIIPDEIYHFDMEGMGIACLIFSYPEIKHLLGKHALFLCLLQDIHDFQDPSTWEESFKNLARKPDNGLVYSYCK